ncbi:hypothetical protein Asp14428_28910 [Actinoplanes sp. NBRC 14428]|nr:hypothetical protein Asp14428_28910 [Actinoplanes sp. NBRC 14428]
MWSAFAGTVGGSAAGLTGLMFIVVAFRYDVVAVSREYRNRAAQALTLFMTVTVSAALIVIPQPTWALGIELLGAAAASAILLLVLDAAARAGSSKRAQPVLVVALTAFEAGIALGGAFCLAGRGDGLGFYAPSALLGLLWGVHGAWIFLTRAGTEATS